jgi:hypothetical protein
MGQAQAGRRYGASRLELTVKRFGDVLGFRGVESNR